LYPHKPLFSGHIYLNIPALTSAYHPDRWPEPHPTTLSGVAGHAHNRAFTSG
jgi:hypothetical protein